MKTIYRSLIGLAIIATTRLMSEEVPIAMTNDGIVLRAFTTNGVTTFIAATNSAHDYKINHLSIEAEKKASPVDYILSGDIIVSDVGVPPIATPLPVFLGSSLHPPCLAAITDAQGRFCFRVWLKENRPDEPMQVVSITNADLYIGRGNIHAASELNHQQFEGDLKLKTGLVRKYSIAEQLTDSQKAKLLP